MNRSGFTDEKAKNEKPGNKIKTTVFLKISGMIKNVFKVYVISVINSFAEICALFLFSVKTIFSRDKKGRMLISDITKNQIYFTGVQSFFLISIISFLFGAVVTIQSVTHLSKWNASEFIGKILVLVILRELGPIFTSLIVIGRSATAMATEIGNMVVSKEIEALKSMGIDPIKYIAIPRLISMVVSMVILTVYFNVIGVMGGFLAAKTILSAPYLILQKNFIHAITYTDITVAFLKSFGFGVIIAVISVHQGLKVKISPTEVPQAATCAVVNSLLILFIYNSLLTILFYL
ncbi:MAG: ABC transporter permease [Elusimicrobia bacterium]|nr:ABC transporter permease [Elusimicrobiota bacterium]